MRNEQTSPPRAGDVLDCTRAGSWTSPASHDDNLFSSSLLGSVHAGVQNEKREGEEKGSMLVQSNESVIGTTASHNSEEENHPRNELHFNDQQNDRRLPMSSC
jgi:hypothetical protein